MPTVKEILQQGEGLHVEFKTSFNVETINTLVAFANTKGGVVYIGVSDTGSVKGVSIGTETVQQWINEVKTKTEPAIIPEADVVEIDGQQIVALSVTEFPVKPVSVKGRYFKRVKNANHQLSTSEISDVYMRTMQYSWDAYPYSGATFEHLNHEKIRLFIAKVNTIGRFRLPEDPKAALRKLRMIKDETPTNAAMILFSKENLLYNVHIGRFKTPSLIIADKMINGNLYDVVEESMQTIIGHLNFAFEIKGRTTQRAEIPEYPLEAIREILLNAIIHRDYTSPTDIQIKIFDRKITFFNPGGLYGDLTEAELQTDSYHASTRNKQIAEAFYLTHDIEKYGSGFLRVRKEITQYPTMLFEFHEVGSGFIAEFSYTEQKITTELENIPQKATEKFTEKFTENAKKILEIIYNNPNTTINELSEILSISRQSVIKNIAKLKARGFLERIGPDKGGYWQVKDI
ncbi:MAG: putative DNA binding domain-containing protein [Bacteroidales bacterium]|jgi:ATP-dependent DNA helicase RecG|nr:putative DNA binding domain-containing protein [Bacteroidales bacterium]